MTTKSKAWRAERHLLAVCSLALLVAGGCRTYDQQVGEIRSTYLAGAYGQAADLAMARLADERGGRDELLWSLETASLLRSAGRWSESARVFDSADQLYEHHQQLAKVRVASEGLALVTNPAKLPYDGHAYDGIMISVYQALQAMQRGDRDAARVYINRTYERQQAAVAENAARIEKEQAQIGGNASVSQTLNSSAFASATASLQTPVTGLSAYADYVNPFAVYLDGLYHWNAALDTSDVQRAQKCFERLQAFAADNPYIREDLEAASKATAPRKDLSACYVLFETGLAPSREAIRIDVPIIVTRVSYVGISFPRLRLNPACVPQLAVETDKGLLPTCRVASMEAIVAKDFQNELPSIMAHAVASAAAKAAAGYALNMAAKDAGANDGVQLLAQAATALYQVAMNVADTRTWNTLPKEFQICKTQIPANRKLVLTVPGSGWRQELTLGEGRVVVVWVKAVDQPYQMSISQFALR
jgi:hypothetical protein